MEDSNQPAKNNDTKNIKVKQNESSTKKDPMTLTIVTFQGVLLTTDGIDEETFEKMKKRVQEICTEDNIRSFFVYTNCYSKTYIGIGVNMKETWHPCTSLHRLAEEGLAAAQTVDETTLYRNVYTVATGNKIYREFPELQFGTVGAQCIVTFR